MPDVKFDKMRKQPYLSIVIVSYNTKDLTRRCLRNVQEYSEGIDHEVIVVDNGSSDGTADMVSVEFPNVQIIRLIENRGFAGGNIPGMKRARGRYILLLNSDAFLTEGTLEKTISFIDRYSSIGVLGCRLYGPDGIMQPSARMLPGPLNKILHITGLAAHFPKSRLFGRVDFSWWDHSRPRRVGWVVGAFFMIRREAMEDIGFLDDRYFLYFEEVDFCLTAKRAGWDVVFYPHTSVVHLCGESSSNTGRQITAKGKQIKSIRIKSEFRYYRKLYGFFHVLISASIEMMWSVIVIIRNIRKNTEKAIYKRKDAFETMKLIFLTLKNDNWGKLESDKNWNNQQAKALLEPHSIEIEQ